MLASSLLVKKRQGHALTDDEIRFLVYGGHAMDRFEQMVSAQGGRLQYPLELEPGHEITAPHRGYIAGFDCVAMGQAIVSLGGGRRRKNDTIDHRIGIRTHGRIGDAVERGAPIFTLHCHPGRQRDYLNVLSAAVEITEEPVPPRPLILQRLGH